MDYFFKTVRLYENLFVIVKSGFWEMKVVEYWMQEQSSPIIEINELNGVLICFLLNFECYLFNILIIIENNVG